MVGRKDLSLPGLARTGGGSSQRAQGSVLQRYGFQKFPLGFSVSLHFHCNKQLQCALVGTDLLLRLMQSQKPAEALWKGNVYPFMLSLYLEKKNKSIPVSPSMQRW